MTESSVVNIASHGAANIEGVSGNGGALYLAWRRHKGSCTPPADEGAASKGNRMTPMDPVENHIESGARDVRRHLAMRRCSARC